MTGSLYFNTITVCFVESSSGRARLEGFYNNLGKRADCLHQLCSTGRVKEFLESGFVDESNR